MAASQRAEFSCLDILVGERLYAVSFVLDYIKLDFDVAEMTIMSVIEVSSLGFVCRSGEPGFRDQICSLIGKDVLSASGLSGKCLEVTFSDQNALRVSLSQNDRDGPEAAMFETKSGKTWTVWP